MDRESLVEYCLDRKADCDLSIEYNIEYADYWKGVLDWCYVQLAYLNEFLGRIIPTDSSALPITHTHPEVKAQVIINQLKDLAKFEQDAYFLELNLNKNEISDLDYLIGVLENGLNEEVIKAFESVFDSEEITEMFYEELYG